MKKFALLMITFVIFAGLTAQSRIKDIGKVSGMDSKPLIGYGLVIGLQGTGDSPASAVTIQTINNLVENFGLSVNDNRIRPNNVAAVIVTASMPPFAASGSTFDVNVSSAADARSLEGGTLIMTPLFGEDQRKYAVAQGQISMGGYMETNREARLRRNYSNNGRIPNGGIVENTNPNVFVREGEMRILLNNPDFTTAERVAAAINAAQGMRLATATNAGTINVIVPDAVAVNDNLIAFISDIENLPIQTEVNARVVINERTGTIVAGGGVQIREVAISHGNMNIRIEREATEYTTGPYTLIARHYTNEDRDNDLRPQMVVLQAATVQELAAALNAVRVTPRDLISIFQALKEAGALLAELRII